MTLMGGKGDVAVGYLMRIHSVMVIRVVAGYLSF